MNSLYFKKNNNVYYFINGFVEVSADGIGNKSTCPGFGSGHNRREISFLSPSQNINIANFLSSQFNRSFMHYRF